jgi:hypothetical protein
MYMSLQDDNCDTSGTEGPDDADEPSSSAAQASQPASGWKRKARYTEEERKDRRRQANRCYK